MMRHFRQSKIKEKLKKRAIIIQAIRRFFIKNNFLEIDTPIRIPAPAPEAHIDVIKSDGWFLQTSPELCMKELLSAGYSRIFQICKCFRLNERGNKHIPEFTMLEWYCTGNNYLDLMNQCEELVQYVLSESGYGDIIEYKGNKIDLKKPWKRISVIEAFKKYTDISMEKALEENVFDEIMGLEIEPNLGKNRPVFLYDYPAEKGSLSKLKNKDNTLTERFELYIEGIEFCNAFTELDDDKEQKKRFDKEIEYRKKIGKMDTPIPVKFLDALKYMPAAAGIAFGIDRFVMILTDSQIIDDVIAFIPEDLIVP